MGLEHPKVRLSALALASLVACIAYAGAPDPGLIAQPAPDFALPAFAGGNVRLSEYRGQPILLAFWSSRCGLCAAQLQALDRYYDTYGSAGLVVLGVSVEGDAQRAADYAREHATSFHLLFDRGMRISRLYRIERLPSTVLIDLAGIVRYVHDEGRAADPSFVTQIRALLYDRTDYP